MATTVKTACYSIQVDSAKNRMYLTIKGFWAKPSEVPAYLDDIRKASREVCKGFTILSDLTEMKAPPPEVGLLHKKAQEILMAAGLRKTAELLPAGSAITKLSVDNYSKQTGMQKSSFDNKKDAEAWLDQQ